MNKYKKSEVRGQRSEKTKCIFSFVLLLTSCFLLLSPAYARLPKQPATDVFFEGPGDLVWRADELAVGKKTPCELSVHYRGKDPTNALIKIYLDGVNIMSFSVEFKTEGVQTGKFSFRAETEAKHHLEFIIATAGEFQDSDMKNNRLAISFRVPGPVPLVQQQPESQKPVEEKPPVEKVETQQIAVAPAQPKEEEEVVEIPDVPIFHNPVVQNLEEPAQSVPAPQADAVAYLEQQPPVSEPEFQEAVKPETATVTAGKPLIDVFFSGPDSFHNNTSKAQAGKVFSWILSLESSGQGEGEIEVVVAEGAKKVVTQIIWIRAGETVHLPMQTTFDRRGPHHLTAMINTLNNVVDRNPQNNIVEESVDVS